MDWWPLLSRIWTSTSSLCQVASLSRRATAALFAWTMASARLSHGPLVTPSCLFSTVQKPLGFSMILMTTAMAVSLCPLDLQGDGDLLVRGHRVDVERQD